MRHETPPRTEPHRNVRQKSPCGNASGAPSESQAHVRTLLAPSESQAHVRTLLAEWSLRCHSVAPTFAEMIDVKSIAMGRCASKKHSLSSLCGHALDWKHHLCSPKQLMQKHSQLPQKMGIVCRSKFIEFEEFVPYALKDPSQEHEAASPTYQPYSTCWAPGSNGICLVSPWIATAEAVCCSVRARDPVPSRGCVRFEVKFGSGRNQNSQFFFNNWKGFFGLVEAGVAVNDYNRQGQGWPFKGLSASDGFWGLTCKGRVAGAKALCRGFGIGEVVGVAIDLDTRLMQFSVNGALLETTITIPAEVCGRSLYPVACPFDPSCTATLSFPAPNQLWSPPPPDPRDAYRQKMEGQTSGVLHELLQRTPNMEVIRVESFDPFSGPFVSITPSHFHRLKSLELSNCWIGEDPSQFGCEYLHECPSPNAGDLLISVANHCPQLQLLRITMDADNRALVVPAAAFCLLLTKCSKLQALLMPVEIESVGGLFDGVPSTNLRFFECHEGVKHREPPSDEEADYMAGAEDDDPADSGMWGEEHMGQFAAGISRSCPHLQALSLHSRSLMDADVEIILRGCTELQRLDLQECYGRGMRGTFFDALADSDTGSTSASSALQSEVSVLVPKLRYVYLLDKHNLARSCLDRALRFAQSRLECFVFVPEYEFSGSPDDDWSAIEWCEERTGVVAIEQWRLFVLKQNAKKYEEERGIGMMSEFHEFQIQTDLELQKEKEKEKVQAQLEFGHCFANVLVYAGGNRSRVVLLTAGDDDDGSDDDESFF